MNLPSQRNGESVLAANGRAREKEDLPDQFVVAPGRTGTEDSLLVA
jgi:hypothetical protein